MVRLALALPIDSPRPSRDFHNQRALAQMVRTIEEAGFDACSVTDHPYPTASWIEGGGHHATDPLVTLAFAAGVSTSLRLFTNCYIASYRHPYLSAKGVATLDSFSDGRLILGLAVGYLEAEFDVLGVPFRKRGALLDEAIARMREAWSGEESTAGHVMSPPPVTKPHPPIWIGGNSAAARRRAVAVGDGWIPFPAPTRMAEAIRTTRLTSHDDLAEMIEDVRAIAARAVRPRPLDVCFTPLSHPHWRQNCDPEALVEEARTLAGMGVTWMSFHLPAPTVDRFCENVRLFGREAVPTIKELG